MSETHHESAGPTGPPAPVDGVESHFSGSWTVQVLHCVARELGDEAVIEVLRRAGEQRHVDVMGDRATWSSHEQFRAVARAAGEALGGREALSAAAAPSVDVERPGEYVEFVQGFGSPGAAFAGLASFGTASATSLRLSDEQVGDNACLMRVSTCDGFEPFSELCSIFVGYLRALPRMFGFTDVDVVEEQCQTRGAQECVFRVSWSVADEVAQRTELDALRVRVVEARLHDVYRLVGSLAGDDPVGTLHQIVASFAEAAIANVAILVTEDPRSGARSIHAIGAPQAEAERLAAEIDAGLWRDDPTMHVVEVRSAQARYGYLAAASAIRTGSVAARFESHARLAAVALDVVSAQEELARRVRSAESMVALSTALAEIVSPGETAAKLARATPAIVGCDRVLVFLPEAFGEQPLLSAAYGCDDELLACVRASLFGHAVTDDVSAGRRIDACLASAGMDDAIVEPIGPAHHPTGWICVDGGVRTGGAAWRHEARLHLRGVAAQAATAISNAHLLDQIRHQALHDGLTGLPNRSLVQDRLSQMLARARRENSAVGVLFIDLDGFKDVNDTCGHEAGDELLRVVAQRLTATLRESDVVGRLGGDEFVVLTDDAERGEDASLLAERIIAVLREPYAFASERGVEQVVTISASLGSTRGAHQTPSELLRDADIALYEAKRAGKNRHVRFRSDMRMPARNQAVLERALRAALQDGRFELIYQPIFDLTNERVTGAEALLRWNDPVRGVVLPDEFIPTLESTGMIVDVGRWVLEQACQQGAVWHDQGFAITVSVNVSMRQLENTAFLDTVRCALDAAGLPASFLNLEITETAIMRDPAATVALLHELKTLGVRIAIDDFGTGYSSLAYLQQFPVDAIKIDRSFIAAMTESSESDAIIRALVELGKTLGLETLAEGIEDHVQRQSLEALHCDSGQGYLFAVPLSVEGMGQLLTGHASGPRAPDRVPRGSAGTRRVS